MVVVTRRLEHENRKLEARLHILDALAKIYDDLDRAIRIIRKAESRADAAEQPDGRLRARPDPGRRDPRDPPLPAGAARDREDPRRARREAEALEGGRGAAREAARALEADPHGARGDRREVRRQAPHQLRRRRGARVRSRGLRRPRGRDRRALARRLAEARPRGEGPVGDAAARGRRALRRACRARRAIAWSCSRPTAPST